jgi:hypothetical protein
MSIPKDYDGKSDGAIQQAMQRLLIQEEARRADMRPQILPRGMVANEKRRLLETVARKIGVEEEYQAWVRTNSEYSQQLLTVTPHERWATMEHEFVDAPLDQAVTGGIGGMWWARTDWAFPGGMKVESWPDGLHLSGQLNWSDGDLWQGNLQVLAKFVLDPNRMPPGGPGRFSSVPYCELFGQITGITGWSWGDDWSKCWLHIAQLVNGGPAGARIGEGHDHRNMFFIAGSQSGPEVSDFPGFMQCPRVDFNLDPAHPLLITLEIRLDFQLEGSSAIWFGSQRLGQPPIHRDALLRTLQWNIQRV